MYEIERRQVGERNVGASRYANIGRQQWRSIATQDIFSGTPHGEASKQALVQVADSEQRKGNRMIGAELGYRYVDSPCIDNIPGGPEHRVGEYHPNVWPGSRLPHCWLDDGTAIQDHLPETYILLSLGNKPPDTTRIRKSFEATGAPVTEVKVRSDRVRDLYGFDFLVLRPDMHVVWRGTQVPRNASELVSIATGHGRPDSTK